MAHLAVGQIVRTTKLIQIYEYPFNLFSISIFEAIYYFCLVYFLLATPRLIADSHELHHMRRARACVCWASSIVGTQRLYMWNDLGFFFHGRHQYSPLLNTTYRAASFHLSNVAYASLLHANTAENSRSEHNNGWKWCDIFNGFVFFFLFFVCEFRFGPQTVGQVLQGRRSNGKNEKKKEKKNIRQGNLLAWDLCSNSSRFGATCNFRFDVVRYDRDRHWNGNIQIGLKRTSTRASEWKYSAQRIWPPTIAHSFYFIYFFS